MGLDLFVASSTITSIFAAVSNELVQKQAMHLPGYLCGRGVVPCEKVAADPVQLTNVVDDLGLSATGSRRIQERVADAGEYRVTFISMVPAARVAVHEGVLWITPVHQLLNIAGTGNVGEPWTSRYPRWLGTSGNIHEHS